MFGAIFPLVSTHWWYPTSYAIFLLFVPFINSGLKALKPTQHVLLAIILLMLYSLFPFSFLGGIIHFDMSYSVWLFLYQYVLITLFNWHFTELLSNFNFGQKILSLGLFLGIGTQIIFGYPLLISGRSMLSHQLWLNTPACLPSMMIALGFLILANSKEPVLNRLINKVASGTLAVYLVISDYSSSQLIGRLLGLGHFNGAVYLCVSFLLALAIFAICIGLDLVRQLLMKPLSAFLSEFSNQVILKLLHITTCFIEKCHRFLR